MRDITVLLTRIGSLVAPSHINTLRSVKERKVRIIGVDTSEENAGSKMVNKFYQVGTSARSIYTQEIIDIAKAEQANVVLPSNDGESLEFRMNQDLFDRANIVLDCPDKESLEKVRCKDSFYNNLKKYCLPYPKFYVVESVKDLESAAQDLGYPREEVVIKPIGGVAERGFHILSENIDRRELFFNGKPSENVYSNLREISLLFDGSPIPRTIVSEYLPGTDYTPGDCVSTMSTLRPSDAA